MATGRLFLWSAARGEWVNCPPDEITWLDRRTLSGDEDVTLHRAPRCAGFRYVHHRWELFSRDTTYRVYLAPDAPGTPLSAQAVERTARHVLPVAPARYEALPVPGWCGCDSRWPPADPPSRRFLTLASRSPPGPGLSCGGAADPAKTPWPGCAVTSSAT